MIRLLKLSKYTNRAGIRYQHSLDVKLHPVVTKFTISIDKSESLKTSKSDKKSIKNGSIKDIIDLEKGKNISSESKKSVLPPSLQYVRNLMDHYKDNVVLTQMGSFYELYFEQAVKFAPQLNISLTSRNYIHGKVPFAGFPITQLSRHLKVLVNEYGHSVTIAQQFKKDEVADNEVNKFFRRVTRIVTPGTFIDEAFENFQENSYLLAVEFPENCMDKLANPDMKLGLCWCDVSTGELFVQQVSLKDLISAVTRIQPKEILLDDSLSGYIMDSGEWYPELVELKKYFLKYQKLPSKHRTVESFFQLFSSGMEDATIKLLKIQFQLFAQKELAALRNTLVYVNEHLPDFLMNFQIPQRQSVTSIMQIDSRTSTALELHSTVRDRSRKGSLLSTVRRTVTPIGTRLLTQWLSGPSLDIKEIKIRQTIVSFFLQNMDGTTNLIHMLRSISDLSRTLQRFSFGQGEAIELIQLAKSLNLAREIREYLLNDIVINKKLTKKLIATVSDDLIFDRALIAEVLDCLNEDELERCQKLELFPDKEEIPRNINNTSDTMPDECWIVRSDYNKNLKNFHKDYRDLHKQKANLLQEYNELFSLKYEAKNVFLKQKQNNEYVIHILGSSINLKRITDFINSDGIIRDHQLKVVQHSAQTRWLSHKPWTNLGYQIELARLKITQEEKNIMNNLKKKFISRSNDIRAINNKLGYLDVLSSFAVLANDKNLVSPRVDNSSKLEIIGGRHLMVEEGLSHNTLETFVDNDCKLEKGDLWVITGPNMGGKSTYLRQNAIIVILAQIGCFVPCTSAHIGLVDKIFSRVGSADDLYNELSTFMVEMIETSFILHGATNQSLAILDEIGRGTSGIEGTSIAFATLKYLIKNNSCRSLFATHFGQELKDIIEVKCDETLKRKIKFYQTGIVELNNTNFYYDHKLKEGICKKSDAIRVARYAGFPEEALNDANLILLESS